MTPTREQQMIIDAVLQKDKKGVPINKLVAVDSCAGSGKTTLLVEICEQLKPAHGVYLAYTRSVSIEAKAKFPTAVKCSTAHSFAFQNTIKQYGLSVGSFFWKSIKERIKYEDKLIILDIMKEWNSSAFDTFDKYKEYKNKMPNNITENHFSLVKKYFNQMVKGQIPITHDAYLKFYHMLLAHKKIEHKEFDFVCVDEAGDLAPVTFAIFNLLPAKRKMLVGDNKQNIFTFNHTINCFSLLEPGTLILPMSQSFRCHTDIAKRIQAFSKKYIDKNAEFKGVEYDNLEPEDSAYISRNNAQLIGKMIDFNKNDTKYNLLRPADAIFELVLILLNANRDDSKITKGEFKYLQQDIDTWHTKFELQMEFETPLKYLKFLYGEEQGFKTAFHLIREYGPGEIFAAHRNAKLHEKDKTTHAITLGTGFGTKGGEWDKVTIMDDMNDSLTSIFSERETGEFNEKDMTEFKLYYVAASRAKKVLLNAEHLPTLDEIEMKENLK